MAQKSIHIALRCGRLGNRLVLFANFIAFCEEHGHHLSNVTFHSYAGLFETTSHDIYCRYPVPGRRSVFDGLPGAATCIRKTRIFYQLLRTASRLNEKFRPFGRRIVTLREFKDRPVTWLDDPLIQNQIGPARIVLAYDWRFRAPAAMRKHAAKIRAYFRPVAAIERSVGETLERLRQQADIVIGVHIRRGDYRTYEGGKYFFEIPRYAAWMRELAVQFPGRTAAFFVCSDEPRNREEFAGLTVGIGVGPPINDLYTLAGCDFVLGPLSTFSQWASFYGNVPLLHLRGADERVDVDRFQVSFLEEIP